MSEKTEIIKILNKEYSDQVEFALIFGSFASGRNTPDSDIDLAFYLKKWPVNSNEKIDFQVRVGSLFNREVDVIILNDADIIITMQVLANGELILNNNPGFFLDFKARKISQYIDFKRDRKIIEDAMLEVNRNA